MSTQLAILNMPGYAELLLVAFLGLLFFGKRLPDVARSLGKTIVEFKRGIKDTQQDIESSALRNEPPRAIESPRTIEAPPKPVDPPA